ncbi:MAG: thiamine diphosphokinase [Treponema sp.]|nr:thiamine diphosphokinase [Candidatus Treponema equifaecale]
MNRCVIIGAAQISNYEKIKGFLQPDDFYIVCDGGLNHLEPLQITPNLIIGDFDSHENPHLPIETIVLPHEKDDTDSVYALKTALSRGYRNFLFIGMLGNRLDHSLGNLSMLLKCHHEGAKAVMVDEYSEMEIVGSDPAEITDNYSYFSLLNISGKARGIEIKNALYNLKEGEINVTYQYGVSNEVLPGKTATVKVKEGNLLLIKVW